MAIRRFLCVVVVLVGVVGVAAGLAAAGAVSWGKAVEVPGTAALDVAKSAMTNSVACASAGNCAAGGYYSSVGGHDQAFVASEKKGVWGKAIEVPGTAAFNVSGTAQVSVVSCGAVGGCTAGGFYTDRHGFAQPFVVSQKNGVWGKAREVRLPNISDAKLISLSCRGAGNCSGGGYFYNHAGQQAFVVNEVNGVWKSPLEVPNIAALNVGGLAQTLSVSCGGPGDCVAGGFYYDGVTTSPGYRRAWLAAEKGGVWGKAGDVPGLEALDTNPYSAVLSVSCATPGNCSAGGYYDLSYGGQRPYVVSERNGTWSNAIDVPGIEALYGGSPGPAYAQVSTLSCVATKISPSNCSAGGYYTDLHDGYERPFVVSEKSGAWSSAQDLSIPHNADNAPVTAISCATAGNCAAVGYYMDNSTKQQAFVAGQKNWIWGAGATVPGSAALNTDSYSYSGTEASSVSCVNTGKCSIGGVYHDAKAHAHAFVTSP